MIASVWGMLVAFAAKLGLGSGIGAIKLLAHWPAPKVSNRYGGMLFDAVQDIFNRVRVGERLAESWELVFIPRPKHPPESET
jgi:hypothetical protein